MSRKGRATPGPSTQPGTRCAGYISSPEGAQYTDEEREFLVAMDRYKREHRRPYPTWCEVLGVLRSLGYRKADEVPESLSAENLGTAPPKSNTVQPTRNRARLPNSSPSKKKAGEALEESTVQYVQRCRTWKEYCGQSFPPALPPVPSCRSDPGMNFVQRPGES